MSFKKRLIELNRRGLIQGPDESDEDFLSKCDRSLDKASSSSPLAQKIFDIDPNWVEIVYDNKGLRFWEGGCTWIEGDRITLQLKKAFKEKLRHWGYSRDELIAHELVHVARGNFEEPIFEEVLAYQTSSSSFRRFFGPLFRTPTESLVFVAALALFLGMSFFELFEITSFAVLVSLMSYGIGRLLWTQRIFKRTRTQLSKLVGDKRALAVMLRLTDREIIKFSKMSLDEIVSYAKKMGKIKMRWQQIVSAYLNKRN